MIVRDKTQMFSLYERGMFGNRLRGWKSVSDYFASGFSRPVVLRYAGAAGGGWCAYDLTREQVPQTIEQWESEGADPSKVKVNEQAKDEHVLLQGELRRSERYIDLRYTTVPLQMRKALAKENLHIDGIQAVSMLRAHIDPSSLDDLWELLDQYPDSVIEFSVWGIDVGDCRSRNTVFWEVRNY